jgi:hypothetical protein
MGGYDGISSMNHFESMEIDDNVDFVVSNFFCYILIPNRCHLMPSSFFFVVHTLGCANEGL